MPPTCLYVAHRPGWGDNRACDLLRELGWRVAVRCPAQGDEVPVDAVACDGVIVGGALDDVIDGNGDSGSWRFGVRATTCWN